MLYLKLLKLKMNKIVPITLAKQIEPPISTYIACENPDAIPAPATDPKSPISPIKIIFRIIFIPPVFHLVLVFTFTFIPLVSFIKNNSFHIIILAT